MSTISNRKSTLTQFLIEERRKHKNASGDFNSLILDVAIACKSIAKTVAYGELAGMLGNFEDTNQHVSINVQGEQQKKLDVISNDIFIRTNEWGGLLAAMASEEMDLPYTIPDIYPKGKYLLIFDPLDGSSNIDVNVSVGSIFSILRAPDWLINAKEKLTPEEISKAFLQKGVEQVAAGYALYGPTTMLVLSVGNGVCSFTLDPVLGEFILTNRNITIKEQTQEFAINASNSRFWEAPIKRYVDECLAGQSGVRGKDFNMRWIASMVAEAHRILVRGGVFMYPKDNKDPSKPGRLRLLYEANPIGFLIEQAGGRVSTGREKLLEVEPTGLHQRIPLIFGSKEEVERIEKYHNEQITSNSEFENPLFNQRGLFR